MRNKQWYWGLALTFALAATMPAGAQSKQQKTQDQKQAQPQEQTQEPTMPGAKKPAPFDPCTGSGLPPSSQMAPFTPGSPSDADAPTRKKAEGNSPQKKDQQEKTGKSLPPSPGATKAGRKNEAKGKHAFPLAKAKAAQTKTGKVNAPQPTAAEANPFPEAKSRAAQAQRQKAAEQPPPQQGAYSSSNQRLPGVNALGNGPVETQGAMGQHPAYDPALGKQDDKVGHFYLQRHNWAGAYGRYKQAAQVNPGDIHAVIGLAIAADHLGKREEAIRNYKLYLTALPDGPHSKEALQALKRLAKK